MSSGDRNSCSNTNQNQLQAVQGSSRTSDGPRRNPTNMQGLLKFLLETTAQEDRTAPSELEPLDEERREFLMKVFESMSVNIAEKLRDALTIISQVGNIGERDDPSQCIDALEVLADMVDQVDIANDFVKIGGFGACKPCLRSVHSGIRKGAANLIGECAQNNPQCQDSAIQLTILAELIRLLDSDTDEQVRLKSLYAISAIIRGNESSVKFFHNDESCKSLMKALQSDSERLKIKAAFFVSTAFVSDKFLKTQLQKMGFVTLLIQCTVQALQNKYLSSLEHYLSAIITIAKNLPEALEECRQPNLHLSPVLDDIIFSYKDDPACSEAVSYARQLKLLAFVESDGVDADR